MSYGLNSPLYPHRIAGSPLNGIWTLADLSDAPTSAGGGLDAAPYSPYDAQAPSEQFIRPPTFTDVHPNHDLYRMLQQGLRTADEQLGTAMIRRLLIRPGQVWSRFDQKIWRLTLLNQVKYTPDSLLDYLRWHVGFGPGSGLPDRIASGLSPDLLRKLIGLAVPYWKRRGLRSGLQDAIRAFTGAAAVIDDWFWIRWLVGEVLMGVQGEPGSDPWVVYASSEDDSSSGGEMRVEIRVPVTDTATQDLILDLCDLARPAGEKFGVGFVDFVDDLTAGRSAWWVTRTGTPATWVAPDRTVTPIQMPGLQLAADTVERPSPGPEATWSEYVWTGIVRYTSAGARPVLRFYVGSTGDRYDLRITPGTNVQLVKVIGGADTVLATDTAVATVAAYTRGYRIDVQRNEADTTNVIRCWLDGEELFAGPVTDNALTSGAVEIANGATASAPVQYHRQEIWQRPLRYVNLGA